VTPTGVQDNLKGFDMAKDFPNWTAHARRMGERAAVKRAFERESLELPV